MSETTEQACALWYWRHGFIEVVVHDDEQSAVNAALDLSDSGEGAIAGVQYSDGRYVERGSWEAYEQEDVRRYAQLKEQIEREAANPQPVIRTIRAPWDASLTTTVLADSPRWLGAVVPT